MKIGKISRGILLSCCFGFMVLNSGSSQAATAVSDNPDIAQSTRDLMAVTERLRGLEFIHDLPVELVTQEEMADIIEAELDKQLTDEIDKSSSELFIALGLLPDGASIKELYQQMAEEQVAGLYDPREKKFYVVDIDIGDALGGMFGDMDSLGGIGDLMQGFMEGMMGFEMTDIIIVHELTHALDDQYYHLDTAMDAVIALESDDIQLAYQSLIEGNATRIMNDFTYSAMGFDPSMAEGLSGMSMEMMEGMMDYIPFMERTMLAPYMNGEEFVRHILSREGEQGLADAYENPPVSMEQILHPIKYTPYYDTPSEIENPDLSGVLRNWEHEASDTLGELLIAVMFESLGFEYSPGQHIAEGWDGDRITSWRNPSGSLALAWVTVWDDDIEAIEFYENYLTLIEDKYPGGNWNQLDSRTGIYEKHNWAAGIEIKCNTVVIVERVQKEQVLDCLDAAWDTLIVYQ